MTTAPPPAQATHQGNNFDAIRIVAAAMVLVSHHFPLTGQLEPNLLGVTTLGGLAVTIFFVISGYLVSISWWRDPNIWRFAQRRFLRIWPALTVVILLTTYVLGTWVSDLPPAEYLLHPGTSQYLQALWMRIHFSLPGVFADNSVPVGAVNGSLWTIPIEVRCYIALGIAGLLGLLRYRTVLLLGLAVCMVAFLNFFNPDVTGVVHYGSQLAAFFLAGVGLAALERHWRRRPITWALVIIVACAFTWTMNFRHTAVLIGLPFLILYVGTMATPVLRKAGRWGDPSYGMYLFAYPVQQTIILYLWPEAGFVTTLTMALIITVILAYASWHLVEKQALKLKPSSNPSESPVRALGALLRANAALVWPLMGCLVGLNYIFKRLGAPVIPDATITYLPSAQAFLEQGWAYFLTHESYRVAPLAYLWPALWGAEPTWIRLANMGLWIGCVWFLWRTCYLLGGWRAGAVAMLLLIYPELVRYFPSEMTEPIFLFGLFGWMHAMARIIICDERSKGVVIQGAVMLAITLLSRPVLQLLAPAALLACLALITYWSVFKNRETYPAWIQNLPTIGWSVGLALILPIAVIIKNGVLFGLWGLGTGSGIALYQGTHPLFQGAEPGFLGFYFDINAMAAVAAQTGDSLSLGAHKAGAAVAMAQLHGMSVTESISFFGRKLWWWLAHHPSQIEAFGSALRKLRLFEYLVLIACAMGLIKNWISSSRYEASMKQAATTRQFAFATFLFGLLLAMIAQLLPILYNSRYSSALLDPLLIPLTSFGIALITRNLSLTGKFKTNEWRIALVSRNKASTWPPLITLVSILALTFGAYNLIRKHEGVAIDPAHMGETKAHLEVDSPERIQTYGLQPQNERTWVFTDSPAAMHIAVDADDVKRLADAHIYNALWETELALKSSGARCGKSDVSYQTTAGQILQPEYKLPLQVLLQNDGQFHKLVTHANHELRPREAGSLRIVLHCSVGTILEWRGTRLLESRHAWAVASRLLALDHHRHGD